MFVLNERKTYFFSAQCLKIQAQFNFARLKCNYESSFFFANDHVRSKFVHKLNVNVHFQDIFFVRFLREKINRTNETSCMHAIFFVFFCEILSAVYSKFKSPYDVEHVECAKETCYKYLNLFCDCAAQKRKKRHS